MDRWVDVKAGRATCLDLAGDVIVCGGTDGLIRFFEHGTLAYRGTVPKPGAMNLPLGHDAYGSVTFLRLSRFNISHDIYYPDTTAISLSKDGKTLGAIYSDHSFVTWDLSDMNDLKILHKRTSHADCVWGVVVSLSGDDLFTTDFGRAGPVHDLFWRWDRTSLEHRSARSSLPSQNLSSGSNSHEIYQRTSRLHGYVETQAHAGRGVVHTHSSGHSIRSNLCQPKYIGMRRLFRKHSDIQFGPNG